MLSRQSVDRARLLRLRSAHPHPARWVAGEAFDLQLRMVGAHQCANAAVAASAAVWLSQHGFPGLTPEAIAIGLAATLLPARFQASPCYATVPNHLRPLPQAVQRSCSQRAFRQAQPELLLLSYQCSHTLCQPCIGWRAVPPAALPAYLAAPCQSHCAEDQVLESSFCSAVRAAQLVHNKPRSSHAVEATQSFALSLCRTAQALQLSSTTPGEPPPTVILDGAHTPASAAALASTLRAVCADRPLALVIAMGR